MNSSERLFPNLPAQLKVGDSEAALSFLHAIIAQDAPTVTSLKSIAKSLLTIAPEKRSETLQEITGTLNTKHPNSRICDYAISFLYRRHARGSLSADWNGPLQEHLDSEAYAAMQVRLWGVSWKIDLNGSCVI